MGQDKSAMARFFSSMKTERIARKVYRSRELARASVICRIVHVQMPSRRPSTRGSACQIQLVKAQKLRSVPTEWATAHASTLKRLADTVFSVL